MVPVDLLDVRHSFGTGHRIMIAIHKTMPQISIKLTILSSYANRVIQGDAFIELRLEH